MKIDQVQLIGQIKEKLSFCSMDYEKEILESHEVDLEEKAFELPDGKILKLPNEVKYKSAEVLVNP